MAGDTFRRGQARGAGGEDQGDREGEFQVDSQELDRLVAEIGEEFLVRLGAPAAGHGPAPQGEGLNIPDLVCPGCTQRCPQTCERKAKYICNSFVSQRTKQWFTTDTFIGLQRIRGIEANSPGGFAEGFHCRKLVW